MSPSLNSIANNILSGTPPDITHFVNFKDESNIIVDSSIQDQFDRNNQSNCKKSHVVQIMIEEIVNIFNQELTDQCQEQNICNPVNTDQDQLETHSNITTSQNFDQTSEESSEISLVCCHHDDDELVGWDMIRVEKIDSFDNNEQGIFSNSICLILH
jgi:hypothetical protein